MRAMLSTENMIFSLGLTGFIFTKLTDSIADAGSCEAEQSDGR